MVEEDTQAGSDFLAAFKVAQFTLRQEEKELSPAKVHTCSKDPDLFSSAGASLKFCERTKEALNAINTSC